MDSYLRYQQSCHHWLLTVSNSRTLTLFAEQAMSSAIAFQRSSLLVVQLLESRMKLGNRRGEEGYLLDGFPRTAAQAETLTHATDVRVAVNMTLREDVSAVALLSMILITLIFIFLTVARPSVSSCGVMCYLPFIVASFPHVFFC